MIAPYYDNATFSDITLRAQKTEVLAHKVVLAANSPSLEAMLQVSNLKLVLVYYADALPEKCNSKAVYLKA